MEYTVKIYKKGRCVEEKAESGTNLLKFLRKNDVDIHASCGGHGTCGKCKIKVEGLPEIKSEKEKKLLGQKSLDKGYRLACYHNIKGDLSVFTEGSEREAKIETRMEQKAVDGVPLVSKKLLLLKKPNMDDQLPDMDRLAAALPKIKIANDIDFLRSLPDILRDGDYQVTVGILDRKVILADRGDTTARNFGIALDIGTTTLAAYLYNLNTGSQADVYALLNPQGTFGGDVISRIQYSMESPNGLEEMKRVLVRCINEIIEKFCGDNGISRKDVSIITFAGNTTMMHFLMGIPAGNMATAPFVPVTTQLCKMPAKNIGVEIHPMGYAVVLPAVSAYVGADTVAAVLASGMHRQKKISLLMDIGTNGEIVLGNSHWMYACAAAAGPAFEGANIRNGVGGVSGAIDHVVFQPELRFSTIGNEKPVGLCGSGLVDLVAGLLKEDVIEETGRFKDPQEILNQQWKGRMSQWEGMKAFLLAGEQDTEASTDILLTQRDIRELQNAKAAIAAGVKVLVNKAGIGFEDIDRVYLAGGFGSCMDAESASAIGLIPPELAGKVRVIGNAAGAGAVQVLLSGKLLKEAEEIQSAIQYIELSGRRDFSEEYMNCMLFHSFR